MQASRFVIATVVATAAITASHSSRAADAAAACTHPALARGAACAAPAGIDVNTFIVQPPASTRWVVRSSSTNGDHPAVLVARSQPQAGIDANSFLVQPPVSVSWTVLPTVIEVAGAPAAQVR